MNKERRKALADAYRLIDQGRDMVEQIASEERDVFDNMPENLQNGEKGQRVSEVADNLDEAAANLQDALALIDDATQ